VGWIPGVEGFWGIGFGGFSCVGHRGGCSGFNGLDRSSLTLPLSSFGRG
jgi:hypothetical protein